MGRGTGRCFKLCGLTFTIIVFDLAHLTLHSPIGGHGGNHSIAHAHQRKLYMRKSSGLLAKIAVVMAVFTVVPVASAFGEDDMLRVSMNHARVLRLDRPVAKVIIGNAKVADADRKSVV